MREKWLELQRTARHFHHAVPALLDHATVREVSGNMLVLTVNNPFFKEKLDADDRRQALLKALRQVFDVPLKFRVEIVSPDDAPTSVDTREMIANDELVAFGIHQLGGEISSSDIETNDYGSEHEESDNE